LTLVYIQSVDPTVFHLIKLYEQSGIIQIRPSLQMPIVETLGYNPNSETSWQNQLTNFQVNYKLLIIKMKIDSIFLSGLSL
jgi:hypothetical protein